MISVCIVTFNGEKYIREQLNSILAQLSSTDEIIISDDNSIDSTINVINSLNDNRIKILKNESNEFESSSVFDVILKISKNLENALKHASGDIIFLADQDDVWYSNKVEVVLGSLIEYDCVIHDCKVTDDQLNIVHDSFFNFIKPKNSLVGTLYRSSFMGCCMAFKRNVYNRCMPFPNIPIEHDTWIGISALKVGKVKIIDDKLILYRRHYNNVSSCSVGSNNSLWIKFLRRYYIIYAYLFY